MWGPPPHTHRASTSSPCTTTMQAGPRPMRGHPYTVQGTSTHEVGTMLPTRCRDPPSHRARLAQCGAIPAAGWDNCFYLQNELKHVFMHSDGDFVAILRKIRRGTPTPQPLENFKKYLRALVDDDLGFAPTRLYPLM